MKTVALVAASAVGVGIAWRIWSLQVDLMLLDAMLTGHLHQHERNTTP
jgi:hypothetical protein